LLLQKVLYHTKEGDWIFQGGEVLQIIQEMYEFNKSQKDREGGSNQKNLHEVLHGRGIDGFQNNTDV